MHEPFAKREIVEALEVLATAGVDEWASIPPSVFFAPLGEAWSPAENVRHLIKSTDPVATALGLPRIALRAMFGTSKQESTTYSALVERYRTALAAGGTAGRFAPEPEAIPDNLDEEQGTLVERCRASVRSVASAADAWSEADLDARQLPHPLLGKLTVREMLFFTLYHHSHHWRIAASRLGTETASNVPPISS